MATAIDTVIGHGFTRAGYLSGRRLGRP